MPSTPIKPREKPKFEFVTLLDTGAGTGSSGPSPNSVGEANRAENLEATTPKVGHEVLHPISKLPSGLIEVEGKSDRDDNEHDMEDHDQDHDLISVTSSSSCPSLCASSCPSSCSTSEVDTDHEHEPEIKTGGKHFSPKRYSGLGPYSCAVGLGAKGWTDGNENGAAKLLRTASIASDSLLLPPPSPLDLDSGSKFKPKRKEKKKKFILVNDMEIELDESESEEEDPVPLSGRFTNTSNTTTREMTTKTTTKSTTEKTTTPATTVSSNGGSPPSPRSVVAPVPIKSTLGGSPHLHPTSSSASASLITPPTTPPSEQTSRYGSHSNMHNKPLYSPGSSPSAANRGRMKGSQKKGSSTSRERSASMGSDTSGGGGGGGGLSPSSSCTPMRIGSPVKLKSKMS